MKRVAHFVPAYQRKIDIDVAMAIARDADFARANNWTYMPFYVDATGISRARNIAVREAYEHGAQLLLMQDADTFANPGLVFSALERLWKTMHKFQAAVVGAAVPMRNRVDGAPMNCAPYEYNKQYPGEVGTGLMLINLEKLERFVPRPWFVQQDTADGEGVEVGEDIGFCRRLTAMNLAVIVDTTIPMVHAYTSMHSSQLAPE